MRNDERIENDVKQANSLGYSVFWFGIFGALLVRWFYLGQSLVEVLDVFAIWLIASMAQFFSLATRGIPITYPFASSQKEQKYFILLFPLATGIMTAMILTFFKEDVGYKRVLGGFAGAFMATFILFVIYSAIVHYWEKKMEE
ncbi:hypothetical protein SAMN05192551_10275 [Tindallia magadiensis]|uniref:Uncharacterized protein n=1 Tax=Tindallia magadiensis TaxID=69895 RepID=A0A1I3BY70_9FIRM|nr:DUF6773 family protein [Tindallia magadiensis]SFH66691.1 hypothetical protein SAMN05192551_10275 [Tindallia magadiensis]